MEKNIYIGGDGKIKTLTFKQYRVMWMISRGRIVNMKTRPDGHKPYTAGEAWAIDDPHGGEPVTSTVNSILNRKYARKFGNGGTSIFLTPAGKEAMELYIEKTGERR
jgi:hypothetical protein